MPIKDTFSYTDRWDSVGLDCRTCLHEKSVGQWPDSDKKYSCKLHHISLAIELNNKGYKNGEWFCKSFQDNGRTNKNALATFREIMPQLEGNILYGFYGRNGYLKEIPFDQLKRV